MGLSVGAARFLAILDVLWEKRREPLLVWVIIRCSLLDPASLVYRAACHDCQQAGPPTEGILASNRRNSLLYA
jgi:hypothetical protein